MQRERWRPVAQAAQLSARASTPAGCAYSVPSTHHAARSDATGRRAQRAAYCRRRVGLVRAMIASDPRVGRCMRPGRVDGVDALTCQALFHAHVGEGKRALSSRLPIRPLLQTCSTPPSSPDASVAQGSVLSQERTRFSLQTDERASKPDKRNACRCCGTG